MGSSKKWEFSENACWRHLNSMFMMDPLPTVSITSASWAAISNNQFWFDFLIPGSPPIRRAASWRIVLFSRKWWWQALEHPTWTWWPEGYEVSEFRKVYKEVIKKKSLTSMERETLSIEDTPPPYKNLLPAHTFPIISGQHHLGSPNS